MTPGHLSGYPIYADGKRTCRTCVRDRKIAYTARKRLAPEERKEREDAEAIVSRAENEMGGVQV